MKRSYFFDLRKYYTDESEYDAVSSIINKYFAYFNSEAVASLDAKEDVTVVIKEDELPNFHMIINNADKYIALPKTLTRPREFVEKFVRMMAAKVYEENQRTSVEAAKAKLAAEAEDNLLGYIGDAPVVSGNDDDETEVTVNGVKVTDKAEKQKVVDEITNKAEELAEKASRLFGSYLALNNLDNPAIKDYIESVINAISAKTE